MTVLFCAFALAIAALAFDRGPKPSEPQRSAPWASIVAIAVALAGSLFANESLIWHAATTQDPFPVWLRAAHFIPILEIAPLFAHTDPNVSLAAQGLAVLDTLLLVALAYALRGVPNGRALVLFSFAGAALMIGLTLFARGLTSSDLYAYAFYARFGTEAYHSLRLSHAGPLAIVGNLWSFQMLPAAYGPVWLDAARALAGDIPSIDARIFVFRVVSAVSLLALLAGLRALRMPPAFVALLAFDPAVYVQYVADGHNDLFGIALLIWARVAAKRGLLGFAVLLAILAGGSKASFMPLAVLPFVDAESLRRRMIPAALAVAGAIVASLAFGGLAYPRALITIAAIFPASGEPGGALMPHLTTFATLALVAGALCLRRTGWPGSWAFVSLGSVVFPWYAIWGLPYATLDPRRANAFLATFPITAFVLTTTYTASWAWGPLTVGLACAAGTIAYARWRTSGFGLGSVLAKAG